MLIDRHYEAFMGSIEDTGQGSTQTLFVHLLLVPLWPKGTYFVTRDSRETADVLELRRSSASIVAAYATWVPGSICFWATAFAIVQAVLPEILIPIAGDPLLGGQPITMWLAAAIAAAMAIVTLVAHLALRRRLTPAERAQRRIWAELTGSAADLAQLPRPGTLRDDLKRRLAATARARGLGADAFDRWSDVALDPRMGDPETLRIALALARIHVGDPRPPATTASMQALFDELWARLCAVDATVR